MNHPALTDRKTLRQTLRQRRRSLSRHQHQQAAKKLALRLANHPWFGRSQHIAFYQAADGELDTHYLLRLALAYGKTCYLPVLRRFPKQQLGFVRIQRHSRLYKHRFGIKEPRYGRRVFSYQLDMVCLPLVGFDRHGQRLGMGGGFYDRSLASYKNRAVLNVGLAHDCQQVERLANAAWDIPLHAIFTPTKQWLVKQLNTSSKTE